MLYNALVKVYHDCPFSRLSKKFPMVEVLHWCNSHYDVLELRGTKDKVTHAISEVHTNLGSIIKKSLDQDHFLTLNNSQKNSRSTWPRQ